MSIRTMSGCHAPVPRVETRGWKRPTVQGTQDRRTRKRPLLRLPSPRRWALPSLGIHSVALLALLLLPGITPHARAAALPPSASGVAVSVDAATGTYKVAVSHPAWTFIGSLGARLSDVTTAQGRDRIGAYQEIAFRWQAPMPAGGGAYGGTIRRYGDKSVVLFSLTARRAARANEEFPHFTAFPSGLHPMSFEDTAFSPHAFRLAHNATPWVLFDDRAQTAVLSPASDFIVSQMHGDGKSFLGSGLNPELTGIPAGWTHKSLLVVGGGIGHTVQVWGRALTDLTGKQRPSNQADLLLKYFGYWTDNGATYYYNYDPKLGYAGTLLALRQRYQQEQIPIRYLQLDSWWYQKTRTSPAGKEEGPKNARLPEGTWNAYGGTLDYSASPALFPQGLAAFQRQLGLPLIVHARWIDPASPYHKSYRISGIAPTDPRWWDDRAAYLAGSDVVCYEQDWLSEIYPHSPEMARSLQPGAAFADNMARATKQHGQTMQYCMATPRFFLQGAKYGNLTTIRTSGDRFERGKWNDFVYTSLLAHALGLWPWADVFMSTETDNLLLATLSAGPVGTGDGLGRESRPNILLAARADGVLVKPDAPLVPTDASILADARQAHLPLIAATYTDHGTGRTGRTAYVFACARTGDSSTVSFSPSSLGFPGPVYVYNYFDKTARRIGAGGTYQDTLGPTGRAYYVVAPIGDIGIAFLGDMGKFVGTSLQRIPIQQGQHTVITCVAFAPGEESVTLHGFAAKAPTITMAGGRAAPVAYDRATGHFTVSVSPNANAPRRTWGGDSIRVVGVVFQ